MYPAPRIVLISSLSKPRSTFALSRLMCVSTILVLGSKLNSHTCSSNMVRVTTLPLFFIRYSSNRNSVGRTAISWFARRTVLFSRLISKSPTERLSGVCRSWGRRVIASTRARSSANARRVSRSSVSSRSTGTIRPIAVKRWMPAAKPPAGGVPVRAHRPTHRTSNPELRPRGQRS